MNAEGHGCKQIPIYACFTYCAKVCAGCTIRTAVNENGWQRCISFLSCRVNLLEKWSLKIAWSAMRWPSQALLTISADSNFFHSLLCKEGSQWLELMNLPRQKSFSDEHWTLVPKWHHEPGLFDVYTCHLSLALTGLNKYFIYKINISQHWSNLSNESSKRVSWCQNIANIALNSPARGSQAS